MSSVSMDGLSLHHHTTTPANSGMSNTRSTSDYESFADCMRRSPIIASAHAQTAKPLTNINFDNRFSIQSPSRVNDDDLPPTNDSQRRRKHGASSTTAIRKNGKASTINETPLLSHLFGPGKLNSDSTWFSLICLLGLSIFVVFKF